MNPPDNRRDPRVDQARGVASIIMIFGHAFDAWTAPEHKQSAAYLFTRVFAALPLPAFLLLAGTAIAYRMRLSQQRERSAAGLRRILVRRGLELVAVGYAVNLGYALLDGWESWRVIARADVLHVIGLSIVGLGLCMGGRARPPATRAVALRVACAGVVATLACPWLSRLGAAWPDGAAFAAPLVALVIDVPAITAMPLVPLFAWAAVGWAAGTWLSAPRSAPLAERPLLVLALLGFTLWGAGAVLTDVCLRALGGQLGRSHWAVVFNVADYAGRGLLVLGLAPLLVARLPAGGRRLVSDFGRASLWAYVFHIPLCYGRLGGPLRDRMDVASAAPFVLLLIGMSYAVVQLRLRVGPMLAGSPGMGRLRVDGRK